MFALARRQAGEGQGEGTAHSWAHIPLILLFLQRFLFFTDRCVWFR
jgi:hypothetical protein